MAVVTPERYRQCLKVLKLSQRGVAPLLGGSDRLTREWATGGSPVPSSVAVWLESCMVLRKRRPGADLPPAPKHWQHHPVIWIRYGGTSLSLNAACKAAGIRSANSVRYQVERYGRSWQSAFNHVVAMQHERS